MKDRRSEIEAALAVGDHKRHWRGWALGAGLIVAAAAGGWYYFGTASQPVSAAANYRTEAVTREDLTVTITATGTVEPQGVVDISSELSGTLTEVLVDFNETVTKGQVLAKLDTVKLEAQLAVQSANLAAASAQVLSAQTTLDETKDTFDTQSSLFDRGLVTHSTFEAAEAAWKRADSAYVVASANLDLAQANYDAQSAELEKAVIVSPIDGVVLDVAAEPGQIVAASLSAPTLFTIAENLSQMQLMADVAEADIGQVTEGDPASFTVEAYDTESFPAAITQVRYASNDDDGLVTYTAVLAVENPDLRLRPGMTAVADIVVAEAKGVLTVPNAALRYAHPDAVETTAAAAPAGDAPAEDEGGNNGGLFGMIMPGPPGQNDSATTTRADGKSVWVLRDGQPVRVEVTPGATDGSRTEVAGDGLAEGDLVITAKLSTN